MQKENLTLAYLRIAAFVIVCVVIFAVIQFDLFALEKNSSYQETFLIIKNGLPYLLGGLVFFGISLNFKVIYKGTYVSVLTNTLNGVASAFVLYFLLSISTLPIEVRTLSSYVFAVSLIICGYYFLNKVLQLRQQISQVAILRFLTLACVGVILRFAVLATGINGVLADVLLIGFLFGGATSLLYPLKYSKKAYAKQLGNWIGGGTILKVVLGLLLATYALVLRPYLSQMNANWTLIGEWMFIGILAAASFLLLRAKLDDISAPIIMASWVKHTQQLDFKSSPELDELSQDIDAFLQTGNKEDLTLFLLGFLIEQNVEYRKIYTILREVLDFLPKPVPKMMFSWDYSLYEESERLRRKEAVLAIISKLNPELFRSNQGVN